MVLALAVLGALKILPATIIKANAVVGALLALPLAFAAITAAAESALWLLVIWPIALALFFVAAKRFGGRSDAAVDGLAETICPGPLSALEGRPVHHVFCTTNLRTGNNLYLSNRLTWGFPAIFGPAGANTLAGAVQASACLPGAFLARTTNVLGGDPEGEVVVSDGGVYDNMADQWEWGFPNRVKYAQAEVPGGPELLATAQPAAATHLVVVNASRGMEGTSAKAIRPGLKGEIASALGAKDVLYDVSTATRRRLLVEMFARARRDPDDGPGGMLVHIGTSPYGIVESFGRFSGDLGDRARAGRRAARPGHRPRRGVRHGGGTEGPLGRHHPGQRVGRHDARPAGAPRGRVDGEPAAPRLGAHPGVGPHLLRVGRRRRRPRGRLAPGALRPPGRGEPDG